MCFVLESIALLNQHHHSTVASRLEQVNLRYHLKVFVMTRPGVEPSLSG